MMEGVFVNSDHALEEDKLDTACNAKGTAEVGQEISTWGFPGLAAILKVREGFETTVVLTEPLLFPGSGSSSKAVTVAAFAKIPSFGN